MFSRLIIMILYDFPFMCFKFLINYKFFLSFIIYTRYLNLNIIFYITLYTLNTLYTFKNYVRNI